MKRLERQERESRIMLHVLQRIRVRSKAEPIRTQVIADELGVTWRKVTEKVEQLRDGGEWICASQGDPPGYYYAANRIELEEYLEKERSRVMEQLARHKRQREFIPDGITLFENVESDKAA